MVALVTVFLLVASAAALSRLGALRDGRGSAPATLPAEPVPSPPTLTKEYVYAGGRLVAIEEPAAATYPAPAGLLASADSASPTSVSVTWADAAGTVDHYEVERRVSLTDANPYSFTCASQPCADPAASPSKVYLYRVRAVYAGGVASGYSNVDLATTFQFSDDPLNSGGQMTTIRSSHFTELRDAVNAVRDAVGLPAFSWTEAPPQFGGLIRASHYNDLRANLAEALGRLGMPPPRSAPASSGDTVSYGPVQELRGLMR